MDNNYSEEVLADIRNKLSPACNLVALIQEYMVPLKDRMRTLEEMDYLRDTILEQLPKAKQSFDYVRNFELKKDKEFTINDLKKAFIEGRLYEADELELDTTGRDTAFEVWYEKNFK